MAEPHTSESMEERGLLSPDELTILINTEQSSLELPHSWDKRALVNQAFSNLTSGRLKVRRNDSVFKQQDIVRLELVKIFAETNPNIFKTIISKDIQTYGISDPDVLYELAQLCFEHCPYSTCEHFRKFGIVNPEKINNIFDKASLRFGISFLDYIREFDVEYDKKIRAIKQIALIYGDIIFASHCFSSDSRFDRHLISIAKLAARINVGRTSSFLLISKTTNSLGINDLREMYFYLHALNYPGTVDNNLFHIQDNSAQSIRITTLLQEMRDDIALSQLRNTTELFLNHWLALLQLIQEDTLIENMPIFQMLGKGLFNLPDPTLKNQFLHAIYTQSQDQEKFSQLQTDYTEIMNAGWKGERPETQLLIAVAGRYAEVPEPLFSKLIKNKFKRNEAKNLMSLLLTIGRDPLLDLKEGWNSIPRSQLYAGILLSEDINFEKLFKALITMASLINLGQSDSMLLVKSQEDLLSLFQSVVMTRFCIDDVPDITRKYAETIGKLRKSDAFEYYCSRLVFNPAAKEYIAMLIKGITTNTFFDLRYSDPHLAIALKEQPDILNGWRKGKVEDLQSFIRRQGQSDESTNKEFNRYTIADTDNLNDLLLSGTEVDKSCLHLMKDSIYSIGLLGLTLNGKNRLLTINKPNGEIVARMIFRMMFDSTKKVPVLHIDRLYTHSSISRSNAQQWLVAFAKERATELGPSLAGAKEYGQEQYNGTLLSLGGISPFEYADGGDVGLTKNGRYSINESKIIQ